MTIGAKLKRIREQRNFTQKNIADYLNVDQSLVSKIENDEITLTTDILDKLTSLYCVCTTDVLSDKVIQCKTICAIKKTDLTTEDLKVISVINKIALNANFMSELLTNR